VPDDLGTGQPQGVPGPHHDAGCMFSGSPRSPVDFEQRGRKTPVLDEAA
jgi:hypothetical protein